VSVPEGFRKPDREWMSLRSIWWLSPFSPPKLSHYPFLIRVQPGRFPLA